jgi:hypothetical protein
LSGIESRSIDALGGYWPGFGSMQAVRKDVVTKRAANMSESFIFAVSYIEKIKIIQIIGVRVA